MEFKIWGILQQKIGSLHVHLVIQKIYHCVSGTGDPAVNKRDMNGIYILQTYKQKKK